MRRYVYDISLHPIQVLALTSDTYERPSRSEVFRTTTELCAPPRQQVLLSLNPDTERQPERLSGLIWSVLGTWVHEGGLLAALPSDKRIVKEMRLFANMLGKTIAGKVDILCPTPQVKDLFSIGDVFTHADAIDRFLESIKDAETFTVADYKVTSSFTVMKGSRSHDHRFQLIINQWLAENELGISIDSLCNFYVCRDWSAKEAAMNKKDGFPEHPFPFASWPGHSDPETVVKWLLTKHIDAEQLLPHCTPEETWARGEDKHAIIHRNSGRLVSRDHLYDDEASAGRALVALNDPKKYTKEFRPAKRARCESYCAALPFCKQGQAYVEGK